MKRKIIQITSTHPSGDNYVYLFALCDDGTVWSYNFYARSHGGTLWEQIDNVPQGKEKQK